MKTVQLKMPNKSNKKAYEDEDLIAFDRSSWKFSHRLVRKFLLLKQQLSAMEKIFLSANLKQLVAWKFS